MVGNRNPRRHCNGETSTRSVTTCRGKTARCFSSRQPFVYLRKQNEDAWNHQLRRSCSSFDHAAGRDVRDPAGQRDFSPDSSAGTDRQRTFQPWLAGSFQSGRPSPIFNCEPVSGNSSVSEHNPIMKNPWMKKNPFLSIWLSGANAVMGSARAQATAVAKREVASFWTAALTPPKSGKRKTRR